MLNEYGHNRRENIERRRTARTNNRRDYEYLEGMNNPRMNHPGMNYPDMNHPGMNCPEMNSPGINYPGMNCPGINYSDMNNQE